MCDMHAVANDAELADARDLLTQMLQPEGQRIPLEGVLQHRFFQTDLPAGALDMASAAREREDEERLGSEQCLVQFESRVLASVAPEER
jgi:hypothetical protein